MNHAACVENACPAIDLAGATSAPVRVTRLLYLFRDDVLAESEAGRARIRTFYSVAAEWVALYAQRPGLFQATRNSLEQNLPVLDALAHRRPVTVSRAALDSVRQLLDRHIAAAQSESLRAAFQTWRKELDNPAVWSEFNVTVR
ncbi:hypothetical protein [Archangium lansingense]|uniref:Uncharacterized protein n=2 Tax=Archangium lansingense TaxID=2995310 RepID=A0ABT3ZZE1_9BACT|nr:hypothetical protein [Archangium lansinium]MCY1074109.1 hypothetical protein [Archangium lansinium]